MDPISHPTWIPAATASSCEAALSAEEMKAAAKQSPAPDTHTTPPVIEIHNFVIYKLIIGVHILFKLPGSMGWTG